MTSESGDATNAGDDLLVVGAGPCGLSVAVAAREAGLDCTVVDRGPVVGTIERYPLDVTFFSSAVRLELGGLPFIVADDKPTRREALAYYRRVVRHFDLRVVQYEEVTSVRPAEGARGGFLVRGRSAAGSETSRRAAAVVVATGAFDRPNLLGIPGEELPKTSHYFREPHVFFDQDVVVVGGGNSAVHAALSVWRAGGRVTLVHRFGGLDEGVKPWVLPDIRNRIEQGSIAAYWRHEVERIEPGAVHLRDLASGRRFRISNDRVLAMTGYRPDPTLLRGAGVPADEETGVPAHDPDTLETPVPGLFVAGALTAGQDSSRVFIENGRKHGSRIIGRIGPRLVGSREAARRHRIR